jgi:uncharacterized protein (DUF2132 family)
MSGTKAPQPNNPLHGITLEKLLTELVAYYGWQKLSQAIDIRCFSNDPSIKSSLTFLRRTPWARTKVENLFLDMRWQLERAAATAARNDTTASDR